MSTFFLPPNTCVREPVPRSTQRKLRRFAFCSRQNYSFFTERAVDPHRKGNYSSARELGLRLSFLEGLMSRSVNSFALLESLEPRQLLASTPSEPEQIKAVAASSTSIKLTWDDQSNIESGFKIERGTDGKKFSQIATVGKNVETYSN